MTSSKITSFKDLIVWQEAHKLVLLIYRVTKDFPRAEMYGLVQQMRRCCVSISSNIAEGFSRRSYREKIQFYAISKGSLTELENQILIAHDVSYIDDSKNDELHTQLTSVHKLLNAMIKKTKSYQIPNSNFHVPAN